MGRKTIWLRWLICLCLAYLTFEFWAQYRFSLINAYTPMRLRANMGVDFYEAFKLRPNFHGTSKTGHVFTTNELGFRIGPMSAVSSDKPTLLIGGDSKIYSLFYTWEESFTAYLQKKHKGYVHQQALPGGSPALFNHEMWTLGLFDQISPKPKIVIYDFDRQDGNFDRDFRQQQAKPEWKKNLTRLKLSLGGYGIQRMQSVARSFQKQWKEPWPKGWTSLPDLFAGANHHSNSATSQALSHKEHTTEPEPLNTKIYFNHPNLSQSWRTNQPSRSHWTHGKPETVISDEIITMRDELEKRGVRLILLYQPRYKEIKQRDSRMRDDLESFCRHLNIGFAETFSSIDASIQSENSTPRYWYRDVSEGIHFTKAALEHAAEEVLRVLGEETP